ncbi:MAG: DEAD/DEAH box helicase [Gammaproteobacteria bacterium]|nr:DEAD/DEAH box helicase [Gammaproteobacteria bacterium]MCY4324318.1 DEAD/DEAH box helicase [Gammaproteobacteria bacterium]
MNRLELGLLPTGHLHCFAQAEENTANEASSDSAIAKAFSRNTSEGLFALASRKSDQDLSPSMHYWRGFASQHLTKRCLLEEADPANPLALEPLDEAHMETWIVSAPPMRGAEYLSAPVLRTIHASLDDWLRAQIKASGGLEALLTTHAPHFHQLGRVCFHLAENKNDPDYPFAFMATYVEQGSAISRGQHRPLSRALQAYAGAKNKRALIHLLSPIHRAAESVPIIKDLVDTGDIYHPLAWSPAEAYEFLKDAGTCEQCGVLVRLPDWWRKRARPRASARIGQTTLQTFTAESMLSFKVHVAINDESLTDAELAALMAADDGLVRIKGQWVELNREKLSEALAHWQKIEQRASTGGLSFAEGMRLLAGAPADLADEDSEERQAWSEVAPSTELAKVLQALRRPLRRKATRPGSALKAQLRPYQQEGVNWLWLLSELGLGACLADDMGLGKTMQVIALLLLLKKKGCDRPSLLVLPASLLGNWKSELERFAPTLRTIFFHRSHLDKDAMDAAIGGDDNAFDSVDVVLTTYGTLMRQDALQARSWHLLVLDEAQAIKNPSARQTRAVKRLNAKSKVALTGTPIENRVSDLWSLFDFLNPGLLGSAARFKKFVKSLGGQQHDQYAPLRNLVSPYILRRLKTDRSIISDLPEKTEVHAYCGLSQVQAAHYQQAVDEMADALEQAEGMGRRGLVLSFLMRFKQICNHPSQMLGNNEYDPNHSGKFQRLEALCEEIASRQEKVLIFTQFREMAEPLAAFLTSVFGQPGLVLHGGTAVQRRQRLVARFQDEQGPPFFVLSLKAGGTGLNLTEASHVIHFDRWWNPAVENQATDRAFRIGQKKNVLVHKFVCQGTIEENIDALIKEKTALAEDILAGGAEALLTEMDNDTILKFVSLDIDKARAA